MIECTGDLLLDVDGVPVQSRTLMDVYHLIQGREGTPVVLVLQRITVLAPIITNTSGRPRSIDATLGFVAHDRSGPPGKPHSTVKQVYGQFLV